MFEFYNEEASKKMVDLAAFYVAKDNFEKISFDAKTPDKRRPLDFWSV